MNPYRRRPQKNRSSKWCGLQTGEDDLFGAKDGRGFLGFADVSAERCLTGLYDPHDGCGTGAGVDHVGSADDFLGEAAGSRASERSRETTIFCTFKIIAYLCFNETTGFQPDHRVNSCDWYPQPADWPGCGIRPPSRYPALWRGIVEQGHGIPEAFQCTQDALRGLAIVHLGADARPASREHFDRALQHATSSPSTSIFRKSGSGWSLMNRSSVVL